jgi:hypothetical protein
MKNVVNGWVCDYGYSILNSGRRYCNFRFDLFGSAFAHAKRARRQH